MGNHPQTEVFFIIRHGEQWHYIFKRNLLRFRLAPDHERPDVWFLQFIHRDNDRVGFFVSKEQADYFRSRLPHPPIIMALDLPWRENVGTLP